MADRPIGNGKRRVELLEDRVGQLEERVDSGFAAQGRQIERLTTQITDDLTKHDTNHHGPGSVLRETSGPATVIAGLVYVLLEVLKRVF